MIATLLPNAKQQFIDENGVPLVGGTVTFYIPNSDTLKNTWQDSEEQILNDNPLTLDARGQAIIYGSGEYRQVVKDAEGNLIWDQLTQDITSTIQSSGALFCGTSTGIAAAQVVSPNPAVTVILTGQQFSFFAGFDCPGAMTLQISAIVHNVKIAASDPNANAFKAGMAVVVEYDGTNLQLLGAQPTYALPAPGTSGNLLESDGTNWTSATPKLPAPGSVGNILTSTGTTWTSSPITPFVNTIITQTFLSSDMYIPSSGLFYTIIEIVGGGGGGGSITSGNNQSESHGGGGGGGYSKKTVAAIIIGISQSIIIGDGGIAGNPGGDTSFGSIFSATGGSPPSTDSQGGIGGDGIGGDINVKGGGGGGGILNLLNSQTAPSGLGGSSFFGGGGASVSSRVAGGVDGLDGEAYGSGGSGGSSSDTAATLGGTGSAGIVIITEFCYQ